MFDVRRWEAVPHVASVVVSVAAVCAVFLCALADCALADCGSAAAQDESALTPQVATTQVASTQTATVRVLEDESYSSEDDLADAARVRGAVLPAHAFEDSMDVELVDVEVWVTDRDGQPVRGLGPEAFAVFEDGDRVEIGHFAEVVGAGLRPFDPEALADTGAPQVDIATADGQTWLPGVSPRELPYLVLYLDETNLTQAARKRIVRDLRTSVRSGEIDPARMMVVAQGLRFEILVGPGSNADEVQGALADIDERTTQGERVLAEETLLFERLYERVEFANNTLLMSPCEEMENWGVREVNIFAQADQRRSKVTLENLSKVASSLGGIDGPKVLLYAGHGLQVQPMVQMHYFLEEYCPGDTNEMKANRHLFDLTNALKTFSRHANAQQVTFYALDMRNRTVSASVNWEDKDFRPSATFDQIKVANYQGSLSFLADDTGGRTFYNHTGLTDALGATLDDLDHFYSLAYTAPGAGLDAPGTTHVIDVEVEGRGLEVRHRKSYRVKAPEQRMAERLQSSLLLGYRENPMSARLGHRAITPEVVKRGKVRTWAVPLEVTLPLDRLTFVEHEGARRAVLRIQLAARDADGVDRIFHQKVFAIELDQDTDLGAPHHFVVDLEMNGGEHVLAVGVRDEISRRTSYLAETLDVGPAEERATAR